MVVILPVEVPASPPALKVADGVSQRSNIRRMKQSAIALCGYNFNAILE
ncbi:MAG: hypothetical protein KME31_21930 [Tolypothrix carrinoi HA7290-LM1]|nr:hypothetical protein [Tolypothrix carrinoi HA7290-LM1]